jgi:DNA-binding MarR family transcriptional regulator
VGRERGRRTHDELVTREPGERDTRVRRLRLTPTGARILTGALADVEAADAVYFAALGKDQAAFTNALGRLAGD